MVHFKQGNSSYNGIKTLSGFIQRSSTRMPGSCWNTRISVTWHRSPLFLIQDQGRQRGYNFSVSCLSLSRKARTHPVHSEPDSLSAASYLLEKVVKNRWPFFKCHFLFWCGVMYTSKLFQQGVYIWWKALKFTGMSYQQACINLTTA